MHVCVVLGTRPEVIKLVPVIKNLKENSSFKCTVINTGQHKEMALKMLDFFGVNADFNLDLMSVNQSPSEFVSKAVSFLNKLYTNLNPDLVMVQGDTVSTLSGAMSAYLNKIRVCHIEAGLRTGDIFSPWPEEGSRKLVSTISELHFAPTSFAAENLEREGVDSEKIFVSGNTVIDTVLEVSKKIKSEIELNNKLSKKFSFLDREKNLILVTVHRRENHGKNIHKICEALKILSSRNANLQIIFPVHPNPNVKSIVFRSLSNIKNIFLLNPLNYDEFIYILESSYYVITDSGGIQEEAPSFKTPVLVLRASTERPEGVIANTSKLVDCDINSILEETENLLNNEDLHNSMIKEENPFGNGTSATFIVNKLTKLIDEL